MLTFYQSQIRIVTIWTIDLGFAGQVCFCEIGLGREFHNRGINVIKEALTSGSLRFEGFKSSTIQFQIFKIRFPFDGFGVKFSWSSFALNFMFDSSIKYLKALFMF